MPRNDDIKVIPWNDAIKLCEEVRKGCGGRLLSFARWQCRGCVKSSKGDPKKMCFVNGYTHVDKRYRKEYPYR